MKSQGMQLEVAFSDWTNANKDVDLTFQNSFQYSTITEVVDISSNQSGLERAIPKDEWETKRFL